VLLGTTICPNSRGASLRSTGPAQRFRREPAQRRVDQQDTANPGVRAELAPFRCTEDLDQHDLTGPDLPRDEGNAADRHPSGRGH